MLPLSISAYVLCFNNERTIKNSVNSILSQSINIKEILIIDDGSEDNSKSIIQGLNCNSIRFEKNFGRGYGRAEAIKRLNGDFILCCDATNELSSDFAEKCLPYFKDSKVASVSGTLSSKKIHLKTASGRWRSRHLFKESQDIPPMSEEDMLITYGTLMRRSSVLEVGNFDKELRHNEDQELGKRLFKAGFLMNACGEALIFPLIENSLLQVLERYWRWNCGPEEDWSLGSYFHSIRCSLRPMAEMDLKSGDFASMFISLTAPHFCMVKTLTRKFKKFMQSQ